MTTINLSEIFKDQIAKRETDSNSLKKFLEQSSLYTKAKLGIESLDYITFKPIMMHCLECKVDTTHAYDESQSDVKLSTVSSRQTGPQLAHVYPTKTGTHKLRYQCQHCGKREYTFLVTWDDGSARKSGQNPPVETSIAPDIEKKLGPTLSAHYKKGLICESQGFGIGAMSYYRRVVEDKIVEILDEIRSLIPEAQRDHFLEIIEKVKQAHSFDEKAKFIDDSIPAILKPAGNNLLKSLFSAISEGLHSKTDEECLHSAETIRALLELIIHKLNSEVETIKTLEKLNKNLNQAKPK